MGYDNTNNTIHTHTLRKGKGINTVCSRVCREDVIIRLII